MLRRSRFFVVLLTLAIACLFVWQSAQTQSPLRRITNTSEEGISINPSMSGDGRVIAFESTEDVAGVGGVESFRAIRANVLADPATFIQMGATRAPAPAISQDGGRIAFASKDNPLGTNNDGNSEIFLYNGTQLLQITNTSPADVAHRVTHGNFLPSISDDGRFIAFSSNRNLAGQNADGSLEIFVFDSVGATFSQLTNSTGIVGFTDAKISGNSAKVAYVRDTAATPSLNRDLLLQNRVGAPAVQTLAINAPGLALTYGRAISDDGLRVVWSAETANNSSQVFLYDGRNNITQQVTSLGSRVTDVPLHPTINGAGTRIAFATRRSFLGNSDGSVDLYSFEIPSGTFARITSGPSAANAEILSSMNDDGTIVAFNYARVLTGVSNTALANTSEIYMTGTPVRPAFGTLTIFNGASFGHEPSSTEAVAPDSVAIARGSALAFTTQEAQPLPGGSYPLTVGGTTVTVNGRPAQIFFVSPSQVNFHVPAATELGTAEVVITNSDGFQSRGTVASLLSAPGVFTRTGDGLGEGVILNADTLQEGPFDPSSGNLRLIIFSTGVRNGLQVSVTAGARSLTVESIVRSSTMPGLDEIHVLVPADLRGAGPVDLVVRADGRDSNPVIVEFSGDSGREIVINEFLADPGPTVADGDANHDGTRSASQDEFIELVNNTTGDINLGGYQIFTRAGSGSSDILRHTFAANTILRPCAAIVVFGGGNPNPTNPVFGGSQVVLASEGAVTLNNTSGSITLRDQNATVISFLAYGGSTGLDADDDQSLTRSPDMIGPLTKHLAASGGARRFSPGTQLNGSAFSPCTPAIARVEVTPASATIDNGAQQQFTARAYDASNNEVFGVIFSWQSSNTSVATIDQNGLATSTGPGTTEIRATGRGVTSPPATLTVNAVVRVLTTIEVTPNPATIPVTGSQQFTARGLDQFGNEITGLTFTWESTDTNIATVDANGVATGLSQGQTTIKASSGGVTGSAILNVTPATLVINEVLADPPGSATGDLQGDANHDGTRSANDDEFVELVNSTSGALDISGWTLRTQPTGSTTETVRHTFTASTNLPAGEAIVVFGGGGPSFDPANAAFGCAQVVLASSGALSLTNGGLSVVVRNGSGNVVTRFSYGTGTSLAGDNDQSLTRSPDVTGNFVQHLAAAGAGTRRFSPGTRVNGTPFGSCPSRLTSVVIAPLSASVVVGQSTQFTAQAFDQFGQPMTGVTITFASDNTPVATVDSVSMNSGTGVATATVTGQSVGTAHITAQATDGVTTVTSPQATLTVNTATPTFIITGQVTDGTNPVSGVLITFDMNFQGTLSSTTTTTDVNGNYSSGDLGCQNNVKVTPSKTGFTFNPLAMSFVNSSSCLTGSDVANFVASPVPQGTLVISQVYGGGGNAGAPFTHDFIEIFNRGTAAQDVAGWSVQYNSATGTGAFQVTPLCPIGSCIIQPGKYFLVRQASGGSNGIALPTPDATGSIIMAATAGRVALINNTAALPANAPCVQQLGTAIDFVGYGTTASCFEGSGPAPAPSATVADLRLLNGCRDINNNASDFATGIPIPRNSSSPANDCTAADLSITKTDSPDPVITGSDVTYTITVTNNGVATAQSVVVTDNLPSDVTFVSCSSTGSGVCDGSFNNRTITFSSLANGATETITLVATSNGAAGTTITNTATVTSSTTDPNSANNSAQTTTTVASPPSADLLITKADSVDPVTPGGTLTYTLSLTNLGPDTAQSVVVTDNLPADVTFVNCSSDQGGVCGGTSSSPTITFSSLANGVTATIAIQVTVSNSLVAGAVITNAASVTSSTTDPTPGNNSDSEDTTVQPATPTVTSVVVSPSTQTINRGDTQQFTATAFNGATPVPGATFTWSSSNTDVATIDSSGLATGAGIGTTTITATTSDGIGGNVSGTAMLTVQVPLVINELLADPPGSVAADLTGDSNRDGTRSDDDDEFVELLNNSNAPVNVSGVVVADATSNRFTFPANTTVAAGQAVVIFGGGSPPVSDPAFGGALIFTTGTLSLNNTADTVTVKLNVSAADVVIDTHTYGSEANSNQSITQSPDAEVGSAGGSFVQHTTATNAAGRVFSPGTRADGTPFGSPTITRIEVLPATAAINIGATQGFTGTAYSDAGGPEVVVPNVSFIWDSSDTSKATIAPTTGQTTTATAVASGSSTIRARAGGQQGTAALTVNAPTPSLSINNVTQAETNGGTTTFTFQVTLSSGAPAGGVTFDIATADDTAQDDNPVSEDNDYVAQTITGATILEGNTTYSFIVTVNGDAVIEPDETFFVNVTNVTNATLGDSQGVGTIVNDDAPSISIDDVTLNEEDAGTAAFDFTVTLSSASTQTVTVNYATADNSAIAPGDYTAISTTLLTFDPGQTSKLVTVQVNGDTTPESNETFFVDLTSPTNATIADGQGLGTITNDDVAATSADLSLTKTVNNATPNIGERVTFTVTLSNSGPDPATGVQVTDLLPAGLLYVSSTVSQGTYTSGTGVWDVGNVAVSSPAAFLTITATVQTTGAKTNSAQVTASATPDPDSAPNDGLGDDVASVVVTGASNLVINEVVTAPPGSSPPADANDFVELYNKSASQSIDISGMVISSRSTASTTTVNTFTLPGTPGSGTTVIGPNSYLIIVNGTSAYGTAADFNASASTFNLTATSGGIKIELDGIKLDGLAYQSAAGNTIPATFLAFGEGTPFTSPVASGLQDYIRSPNGTDTNDNATDFRRNGTTANVSERASNPTIP